MKTWLLVAMAVASALCTFLSSAPIGTGYAGLLAPVFLIYIALHASSIRKAIMIVFVVQIPLWLILHAWVIDVAFFGWIGLGLYMSVWAPIFLWLQHKTQKMQWISVVITAPILWVGLECLRGIIIFDGYPWYLAGTSIVDLPLARIAMYGSVWMASFLVVAISAVLATAREVRWWTATIIALVCFIVITSNYGDYQRHLSRKVTNVLVIQTNVTQSNKIGWSWERQLEDVADAIELTKTAMLESEVKPSLIVWPETMVPGSGFEVTRMDFVPWDEAFRPFWYWSNQIRILSNELEVPILVGSQTWKNIEVIKGADYLQVDPEIQFNSAVLVYPDGSTQRYDKTFLTPFGERIPYLENISMVKEWVRNTFGAAMLFDLQAGGSPVRFTLPAKTIRNEPANITFATPICFEDTVPSVVRKLIWENGERRAGALINLSNDGWFGKDASAHGQHVREAQMRCIENLTPMIRVANTGISCSINFRGQLVETLPILESGYLHVQVYSGVQRPLSRSIGDGVAWLCLFGSILLIVGSCLQRSKEQ